MKMGIDNLEILIRASAGLGSAAGRAYEDGKIGITDLNELWAASGHAQDLMRCDFKLVVPEWKDLDDMERVELVDLFSDEFEIPQDRAEEVVEGYLKHGAKLAAAMRDLMEFHQGAWDQEENDEEAE